MRQGAISGESLVLVAGEPRITSPFVFVTQHAGHAASNRFSPLLILAEPVEPTADTDALAAAVVEDVRRALTGAALGAPAARLQAAYELANDAVRRFNRRLGSGRRSYLGLTCVVASDSDLCIALASPGQVVVRQERQLFAFPTLESWAGEGGIDRPGAEPLGLRERIQPELLSTRWASGDIVVATSSSVARCLPALQTSLVIATSLDDVLTLVGDMCDRRGLLNGQVAVFALGPSTTRPSRLVGPRERGPRSMRWRPPEASSARYSAPLDDEFSNSPPLPLDQDAQTVQTESAHGWGSGSLGSKVPGVPGVGLVLPVETWRTSTEEFVLISSPSDVPPHPDPATHAGPTSPAQGAATRRDQRTEIRFSGKPDRFATRVGEGAETASAPRRRDVPRVLDSFSGARRRPVGGNTLVELLAGLLLSLTAAVVGVWQITRRGPIQGFRDDSALGLPHVDVWRKTSKPRRMSRLRAAFPRFEFGRLVLVVLVALVLGLSGFYVYSRLRAEQAEQVNTFESDFQTVLTRHAEAQAAADPATAYAVLIDARRMLDELASSAAAEESDPRLETERAAILADLDRLANVQRFSSVQAVGSVPGAAEGVVPRLIAGGGRVYVLTDALYQLDGANRELVRLLGPGDSVANAQQGQVTVDMLRGAAWRDDRIMAVDAHNAYVFDPATGTWSSEPLGTFDAAGFTAAHSVESYSRNLYVLAPTDGQILKFSAGAYESRPEDWTAGLAEEDLRHAVDLAIDGHVFVLLDDGRVLDFFMARQEATIAPSIVPPLDRPVAVAAAPNSPYLYVLNGTDGRMFRIARDGSMVQQFLPDRADVSLADAQDFVIDEGSGIAFILAHDTIFTVRLPAAPQPTAPADPSATP